MEEKNIEKFNPLVSIIIPVYNGANYMREAINSALAQTYKNIEIIVVNDGSTDDTEKIANSYGDKIRYFAKENGGVATALNLAIEKANGEYISWLSHDDVYYLDKIEKQIRRLSKIDEKERLSNILMSNYSLINEKSEIFLSQKFHEDNDLEKLNYPLYPLLKGLVHGCTLLIPKKCFENFGYFDSTLKTTQDYDLWFRIFPKYNTIFMPDFLVKSRWHSQQGSKRIAIANKEADELWIKIVKSLTYEQKILIDNSILSFYQKTYDIVKSAGYVGAEKYLFKIINDYRQRDISKIKVSVIIPFYNRIDWTIDAIKSVLSQTHKNLELIIVDDFSNNDIEPIKKLAENDDRIKLIQNKRKKGVSGARNTGIDFATGEYIAFLDSDDLFLPKKIKKQLEFMIRKYYLCSHTSYVLFSSIKKEKKEIKSGNKNLLYPEIISNCVVATPTVMIHSDIFKNKKNRFEERFSVGEDTCLWINLSRMACFYGLNIPLTKVREHGINAAYDRKKQIEGLNNVIEYVANNFSEKKMIEHMDILNKALIDKGSSGKQELINKCINKIYKSDNLQISDNDLIGNKFNGHDLHFYLQDRNIDSKQLVWNKESTDENTFKIANDRPNREEIFKQAISIQKQYSLNGILNPLVYDILCNSIFLNTEVVHLHLIHNHIFDIQLLPLMSRLKPIVWTLHDPWPLGGHCIHHFDCERWRDQCGNCPNMKVPFELQTDTSTLNFALKKDAIKNSNFEIIVASEWMKIKLEQSPIFENKKINVIPFGINQEIFKPSSKNDLRKKLGIQKDALVILIRSDYSGFKGMDIIDYVLKNIHSKKSIVLLVLKNKLKENSKNFETKEYGWINDDKLLAQIYSASDIFLMPSIVEAFGMMAIEAMNCGTLPIVLEGTALPDTVNAPECGVATKRDKDEYLKAVQYYIDHEDERNERAKKCLEFARKNYNKDDYVDKIIKVYAEAKSKHKLLEEDNFLLEQLKKNAVFEIDNKNKEKRSFLSKIITLVDYRLALLFPGYKNFFPKKIIMILGKILAKL